jgi:hypothetical protein
MDQQKFNFFIPINLDDELIKAGKSGKGKYENMLVYGQASSDDEDTDGEILEPSGYDLTRFLKYGFINLEHKSKEDPRYILGEPVEAVVKGNKFFVKGKLYKDSPLARNMWDTMHIMKSSGSSRKVGWSIEGIARERDHLNPKRITKALITGVALTTSPKNSNSYADIVKGNCDTLYCDYIYEPQNIEIPDIIFNKSIDGFEYTITKGLDVIKKAISTETDTGLILEDLEGSKKKRLKKALEVLNKALNDGKLSPEQVERVKKAICKLKKV